jgi:hypothetical protein
MLGALDIIKFENPWVRAYGVMFMKWYESKVSASALRSYPNICLERLREEQKP